MPDIKEQTENYNNHRKPSLGTEITFPHFLYSHEAEVIPMERDQIYAYISHHKLSFCCACCPCLGNLSSSSSLSLNLWRTREKEGSVQCDCADVQSSLTPWQRWVPILSKCRAALRLFPPSLSFWLKSPILQTTSDSSTCHTVAPSIPHALFKLQILHCS